MTDDEARIGLVVDSETKSDWQEYIEENHDVNSLSQLIRTAVYSHIGESQNMDVYTGGFEPKHGKQLQEIVNSMGRVENKVENIEDRLGDVERHVVRTSELTEMENEIYAKLPTTNPSAEGWTDLPQEDRESSCATPEEVADQFDVSLREAKDILQHLYETVGHVRTTQIDGEPAYWKEG